MLGNAADELFELGEYPQAVSASQQLVELQPPANKKLRRSAWIVMAHSYFELAQYSQAEVAYQQALQLVPSADPAHSALVERLAASVYKQGEEQLAQGNTLLAAEQFLRVAEVAPNSSISVTAQYDGANNLLAAGQWGAGIGVLTSFAALYPQHALSSAVPAKLAMAYQENGEWEKAADQLIIISQREQDPELKREALISAAELYDKAGNNDAAIEHYRSYAHAYPQPFSEAMEARFRLSELYQQAGAEDKRRYWLQKMIDADASAGDQRTERSRYLAAYSSSVFAEDAFYAFVAIKLTLPLKKSLKKKKSALKRALKAYDQTDDYGVQEFATLANYRIGEIYGQLSRDLIDSDRPSKLDALALEQYELLLEEQAYPFEEKAIAIHETNARRSWQGTYDEWIEASFKSLAVLLPARYNKQELQLEYSDEIY